MEQNKLETQFREKLNSREIKPTEMAWDRLNAMLSVAEPSKNEQVQKPKHKFTWLYIAASFIGFLLISTVFLNQKENNTIDFKKNNVVIENLISKESSKTKIKSINTKLKLSKILIKSQTEPLVQTKKSTKNNVENATFETQENTVAEIQPNNPKETIAFTENAVPENIDSLLASAETNSKSSSKNSSVKINSTDLLNQVEQELQVSFREKIFNTITQKYKDAKEALVNRNNQ